MRCNSDKLKLSEICNIARLTFMSLTNYVLHPKVIYVVVCNRIEAKNDWAVVKVRAKVLIDLN